MGEESERLRDWLPRSVGGLLRLAGGAARSRPAPAGERPADG
ncbi:hypothetical protein AB0H57_21055 [Micromonospora sp. NPDC050686]